VPSITANVAYSNTLTAAGGRPPYTWSVASGSLPSGITLNTSTGIVSGTTGTIGQFTPTVKVVDSSVVPLSISTALTITVVGAPPSVASTFFGMHINRSDDPWPNSMGVSFASLRSTASHMNWSDINTSQGVYDWSVFDQWMGNITAGGQDLLYDVYSTPSWASTDPSANCNSTGAATGGCYPPNDLNSDGTGTDQHLKDFVTALVKHAGVGKIHFIEIWNEPNIVHNWYGTEAQLVRMAKDVSATAKALDPKIQVNSPPETGDGTSSFQMTWIGGFFAAGGGQYVDNVDFHCYAWKPEDLATRIANLRTQMLSYGQQNKPVFCTEGSWGVFDNLTDQDQQAAFLARQYLIEISNQVARFYWYSWDTPNSGNLYDTTTLKLNGAGTAYQQIYQWMVGASPVSTCSAVGTVWTCNFTRPNGYLAQAVWDSAQTCSSGVCTTSVYATSLAYKQYRDLSGKVTTISGTHISIGLKPVLLENKNGW
jgi:hypothetical protein